MKLNKMEWHEVKMKLFFSTTLCSIFSASPIGDVESAALFYLSESLFQSRLLGYRQGTNCLPAGA